MKASVVFAPLLLGLAAASPGEQAQTFSFLKRYSITTAQLKLLKQVPKSHQNAFVACDNNIFKIAKLCTTSDINSYQLQLDKCMEPINKMLGKLKFEPGTILNADFGAGVKLDKQTLAMLLGGGNSARRTTDTEMVCIPGPRSLSDISFK